MDMYKYIKTKKKYFLSFSYFNLMIYAILYI